MKTMMKHGNVERVKEPVVTERLKDGWKFCPKAEYKKRNPTTKQTADFDGDAMNGTARNEGVPVLVGKNPDLHYDENTPTGSATKHLLMYT